jgi:hypothetical protein
MHVCMYILTYVCMPAPKSLLLLNRSVPKSLLTLGALFLGLVFLPVQALRSAEAHFVLAGIQPFLIQLSLSLSLSLSFSLARSLTNSLHRCYERGLDGRGFGTKCATVASASPASVMALARASSISTTL